MSEERKEKESALLLMRFYWRDEIYKIGKELNIPYFGQFKDYWDMDHYQGALEISKAITDNELLKLTKEKTPKYGLSLGGFQGKYYMATEKGEVKLSSSWEGVIENVQKALDKWDEKAYGVLQALINKEGRAAYFEIIDEIEKVLGYEYVPSYLLPRFGPLKLIFKTGSNKYPDWTMPSEIIPVVKEELIAYKKSPKKEVIEKIPLEEDASGNILLTDRGISNIADKIVQKRREIKLIFSNKFKTKLFKDDEMAILDLRKLCSNEEDFNNRIQSLTTLIDEIEKEELKKSVNKTTNGSINILEAFLEDKLPNYDESFIANFRNIITLRSKKFPIHRDDPKFIEALGYFGFNFPPVWGELWEVVLKKYLDSLEKLSNYVGARK
jgi:ethanolamine utilization microcompartment shell protein EutS